MRIDLSGFEERQARRVAARRDRAAAVKVAKRKPAARAVVSDHQRAHARLVAARLLRFGGRR